jgi:AraC-like DNA-binding protein
LKNLSHYHSDYEFVYINKGKAIVTVGENIFNLKDTQAVFICGNEIHCISSDEDTVITVLKISNKYFENIFASKTLLCPIINDCSYVGDLLESIHSELISGKDNNEIMAECIATQLLITLQRNEKTVKHIEQLSNKSNSYMLYDEICKKIVNEYNTVTFSKVAEYMHFSEPYFSKVFHNIFGMTFTQYLNTIKIAVAIEKIKENKMSITEIASGCGFNTIRNFNRVFKKLTGYSPNNLPSNFVFLYRLQDRYGLDPTLSCTKVIEK